VITQVTLKLKPQPQASAFLAASIADLASAEAPLAALVRSQATPAAIELLSGPAWRSDPALAPLAGEAAAVLVVGLEGTKIEVDWMLDRLRGEWQEQGLRRIHQPTAEQVEPLWQRLTEFPAATPGTVLKANVVPSALCGYLELLRDIDPECSWQAHAGNGIVLARMASVTGSELSQAIVKRLQPAARQAQGNLVVLSAGEGLESTRQVIWGGAPDDLRIMQAVKQQFDPHNLLNPGRFVYGAT
jgi:FAD/FMN-containing dehydrogenase